MQEHGVFFEGVAQAQNGRQGLIFHLHQLGRAEGSFRRFRHHRGNLLANKPHPVLRENMTILHVKPELVRAILTGHHAHHAGRLFGGRHIHLLEQSVGLGAFDHHRVQKAGAEIQIIGVLGRAHHFGETVHADGRCADNFGFTHDRALRLADLRPVFRATSSTVFTMGS